MTLPLLSMTGHGEAERRHDGVRVIVEVRTVNSRYLKLSLRITDGYASLERQIENTVRKHLRRGAVSLSVRIEQMSHPDDFRLNTVVLDSYYRQLQALARQASQASAVCIESLLALPGVVTESGRGRRDAEAVWPLLDSVLVDALDSLSQMRAAEGAAMAGDLRANLEAIDAWLGEIRERAPLVVQAYRRRLCERVNAWLEEFGVELQAADVVREMGLFADRSDISEEIVRLQTHVQQFDAIARREPNSGRKLEFLIQEMQREANTIGSKANDAEISRLVVDIKTAIERMRELIQNVE